MSGTKDTLSTIAINWAFAGYGAPGAELAELGGGNILYHYIEIDEVKRFEHGIYAAYLEGLDDHAAEY